MWLENFWNNENVWNNEQNDGLKYNLSLLNDTQKIIEDQASRYLLSEQDSWRDVTELSNNLSQLIESQRQENESLEQSIKTETRERLEKEILINEAKITIYEKCGINDNLWNNSAFENFSKWFIDAMILDNYEMAIEVINTNGKIILDVLKQLASWEWIKQIAIALWESVWDLFSGDAYEKWKAVADLWIAVTGLWALASIWKKGLKLWMKQIVKLRANPEKIVSSNEVKGVIWSTQAKIDEIIPKKEFDFENELKISELQEKWKRMEKLTDVELVNLLKWEFNDYPYFQDIIEKFINDKEHPMNVVSSLQNPVTRETTIKQIKEILQLGEKQISEDEMLKIITKKHEGKSIILKENQLNRMDELKSELLASNPDLYSIWGKLSYSQSKELNKYSIWLVSEIMPELKVKLNEVIEWIEKTGGFPVISQRAKSADGILEKIGRMRAGNNWKNPRPEYNLSDMPDAVGWRVIVENVTDLEQIMNNVTKVFWKENIYEIDNFYSSSKKEKPYRVITYTAWVNGVPCELQVTTLKSSIIADIEHNTVYKDYHQLGPEIKKKVLNTQRQVTVHEHNLLN